MKVIEVEGACGTYETNFAGKAQAAVKALLEDGIDYLYLHMEAPDECGHQGDLKHKILSVELIDSVVVQYIVEKLREAGVEFSILVAPDHPTPIKLKTHTSDPVPYVLYRSYDEKDNAFRSMTEKNAKASGIYYDDSCALVDKFIKED